MRPDYSRVLPANQPFPSLKATLSGHEIVTLVISPGGYGSGDGALSGVSTWRLAAVCNSGGGARKSSVSRPVSATFMNCIQTGSAATAPVSLLPSCFFSSKPIQTPQVSEGEKPMNQASVKSLVVPVLPASGW